LAERPLEQAVREFIHVDKVSQPSGDLSAADKSNQSTVDAAYAQYRRDTENRWRR
jgi:hypothetical protein